MVAGREKFLHGPPPDWLEGLGPDLESLVERAESALEMPRTRRWSPAELTRLIESEAQASAHIENEFNPERIRRHAGALHKFLGRPAGADTLLRMHRVMMEGQGHAQPGRYRTVGVRVGTHRPPPPGLVKPLMDELFESISGQPPSVPGAAWAHVQFETIHPFADGNGRTGRAILQAALGAPLPLSRFILRERHTYYELFGRSDWPAWLEWFCRGIITESGEEDLPGSPPDRIRSWHPPSGWRDRD